MFGVMKCLIFALLLFLLGCTSTKYVPIETVHTDSIYISTIKVDSIFEKDSIFVDNRGDTVMIYKNIYKYKYKMLRDTLTIERVDTVRVPYPIEARLTKWQTIKQDIGGIAIGSLVALVLFIIIWLIKFRVSK